MAGGDGRVFGAGAGAGAACPSGAAPRPPPRLPKTMPMFCWPGLNAKFSSSVKVKVLLVEVGM